MKKNVGSQIIGVQMVSATDGSAFTGSVTVYVTGDGGTQAIGSVGSGICTHEGNGFHTYVPAQAETNYGHIGFTFIGTGAVPSTLQVYTNFPQTVDNNVLAAGATGFAAIDTVVDAILVDTGTTIPGTITTLQADTDDIQSRLPAALVGGLMSCDVTAISTDTTAANNLELQYDGTGLTGDTYPATQAEVGAIGASTGGGLSFEVSGDNVLGALKSITFVGVQTGGTYASTEAEDGVLHNITHSGNAIDIVYKASVGGARRVREWQWKGYLASSNDVITVQMYDFVGLDWETRGTIVGQGGTTNANYAFKGLAKHTGTTGADIGLSFIRFVCTAQTAPDFFTDELVADGAVIAQSVGYANGDVWIDTVGGVAGTESFVNGVADNPVLTLADALTIATAVGLDQFNASNGSTITLASSSTNQVYEGTGWNLALGAQDISGTTFMGANSVSGTSTSPTGEAHFIQCEFSTVSVGNSHFKQCGFDGTLTLVQATDYFFIDCYSQVAGASNPIIDMGAAIGATNVSIRRWSGGITISNLAAGDVVTLDGIFGTVTLNGADATVEIRGIAKAVTNNLTGSPTVNDNTVKSTVIDELTTQGDTNETKLDTLTTNLSTVDTVVDGIQADLSNATDGLGALKTLIDAVNTVITSTGAVLTVAERNAIADAMLDRDMATGTDSGSTTVRTVRQALRANRNKVSISGGTMTVTKEDDATASWTATVVTTAGDPISSIDPA